MEMNFYFVKKATSKINRKKMINKKGKTVKKYFGHAVYEINIFMLILLKRHYK